MHQHLTSLNLPPLSLEIYESPALLEDPSWQPLVARLIKELPPLWQAYWDLAQDENIPQQLGLKLQDQVWEIELTFMNNAEMQALNREYRSKDQPTDVLSFTLLADSPQREQWVQLPIVQVGAIFISLEWAVQAVGSNFPDAAVLDHYILERVIHGWLHLMGVNHDSMEEYNRVVGIQKRVLEKGFHEAE